MAHLSISLDFRSAAAQRIGVELRLPALARPLVLRMAAWTPGSYVVRDHARHVVGLEMADAAGSPVAWTRQGVGEYVVAQPPGELRVRYQVAATELGVRGAHASSDHAFAQGAALILWPDGGEDWHATVRIEAPPAWQVATLLPRTGESTFAATSRDACLGAPWLLGELASVAFEALGVRHEFWFDGLGPIQPIARLAEDAAALVHEAACVFGGSLPYREYRFLVMLSDTGREGLEHDQGCALLASRASLVGGSVYEDFLGLVAHEHFHAWNVRRMRPRALWKLDYRGANHTELLWVAEGFTAYYDDLLCVRAGVLSEAQYRDQLARMVTRMHATPGRLVLPLASASHDAWIRAYRPAAHDRNTTQNYYTHGALAALVLDLEVRRASEGRRSLDDAMAELYASTYGAERGYDLDDVCRCLNNAAGRDLCGLVDELAYGPFEPDLDQSLATVGLALRPQHSERPYCGLFFRPGSLVVASATDGSPAATAGLAAGDEILAVEGLRVTPASWAPVLDGVSSAGGALRVLLARRGRVLDLALTPVLGHATSWRIEPMSDAPATARAARESWLAPRRR